MKSFLTLLLVATGVVAAWGATAPKANDPAIQMTPFEVQANAMDFRKWIKVGSPNFTIYTDAKPAEASQALRELEMLNAAMQSFFGRRSLKLPPVTLIMPTAGSDWRKLAAKGNVEWEVAVSSEADEISDLIVVQYDWQDHGPSVVYSAQAKCTIRALNIPGPFWFHRGIGTFFETVEFTKEGVTMGRQNPRTRHLEHQRWLPWDRFFQVDAKSDEFTKEKNISLYQGQASLFLQYLFTNPDRAWVQRLTSWLDYLNAGHAPAEKEFKQIFTQDFKAWGETLNRYTQEGRYHLYTVKLTPEVLKFPETKTQPDATEMRELFVLAQVLVRSIAASQVSLDGMLAKPLKTESLRPFLVAACVKWKRKEATMDNLRKLMADGSKNPLVYTLAAHQLSDRNAPTLSLDARLGEEVTQIRAWCKRAIELEPLLPEANLLWAWAEALAPEVDQYGIATIESIYARLKNRQAVDDVIMALAFALQRVGDLETSRSLCLKLKDDALGTKRSREMAAQLLERMKVAPPR